MRNHEADAGHQGRAVENLVRRFGERFPVTPKALERLLVEALDLTDYGREIRADMVRALQEDGDRAARSAWRALDRAAGRLPR